MIVSPAANVPTCPSVKNASTSFAVAPAVPPGMGMLRTSYMATHTREQLDRALAIFSRVLAELNLVR